MKRNTIVFWILVAILSVFFGYWWIATPHSYDDCILKNLSGSGKSDEATYYIEKACRSKFPEKKKAGE